MASSLLRPYELPPFEVVKLIQPAFASSSTSSLSGYAYASTSFGSPGTNAPASTSYSSSWNGAASPPNATVAGASASSPPTTSAGVVSLSNRLSQLVAPKQSLQSAIQIQNQQGSSRPNTANSAQSLDAPRSFSNNNEGPIAASTSKQVVRTAEAGGDTVYIGGNEGGLAVWKLDPFRNKGKQRATNTVETAEQDVVSSSAEQAAYLLEQHNVVQGRRPVEKLAILPTVAKALVLSEGVLTLYALPSFAPLAAFAPIRGVSTFAVDLSNPHASYVSICVIKRRSMQLYRISQYSIEQIKDLPLRTTAILGVLRRNYLCIADSVNYSMVDLEAATLIPLVPISQDPPDSPPPNEADQANQSAKPKSYQRPSIVAVGEDEFLVASHTAHTTLGLFIRENGEPTRGTLEWASNPKSIVVDHPYIVALLQNNTLEVHSLVSQEIVQVIQLDTLSTSSKSVSLLGTPNPGEISSPPPSKADSFQPRALISCSAGFPIRSSYESSSTRASPLLVPQASSSSNVEKASVRFTPEKSTLDQSIDEDLQLDDEEIPSDNEQKPGDLPSTPQRRPTSGLSASRPISSRQLPTNNITTVAANTLILGRDSVLALCPLTLVAQADALISNNRINDALDLLKAVGSPDTPEKEQEYNYINQKAAWTYLFETRFKDARYLFQEGRTDPRLLIKLFPHLVGDMLEPFKDDQIMIFQGLQNMLGKKELLPLTIDGIISHNLVRNYSPHLPPSSPTVTDLHSKLEKAARTMLREFLRQWRTLRRNEDSQDLGIDREDNALLENIDVLVDTVLAKLYLETPSQTPVLLDMLEKEAHSCKLDELVEPFESHSLHWYLSQLYLADGRIAETLRIWTELVDGERTDTRFVDGLDKIYNLLETSTDAERVMKYGLWLSQRNHELGLKLLTKPAQGVVLDVERCLSALKDIDQDTADTFLEHCVYTRKNLEARYYDELIDRYLTKLSTLLATTDLKARLKSLREEYAAATSTSQISLLSYVLNKEALSEPMILRGKLVLLLHASNAYDVQAVKTRLERDELEELFFEKAIVSGKLGLHQEVLKLLATTLRDLVAAESYCTHAGTGDILGPKNIRELVSKLGVQPPTALLRRDGRRKQAPQAPLSSSEKEVRRKELLNLLIKISLERCSVDPTASAQERAAHIIQTQAIRIDSSEILSSIPDEWPLHSMQNFFVRSFRRSLHEKYEGRLVKALLQGKDMEVSLRYYDVMESLGGTLAEEASDDGSDGEAEHVDEKSVVYLEKDHEYDNEKAVDVL